MSTSQIIIFKYCPLPFLYISCLFLAFSLAFLSLLPHLFPTASSPFSSIYSSSSPSIRAQTHALYAPDEK